MKRKQIQTYNLKGISHLSLEDAKETLENRDHGVLYSLHDFHKTLSGEWHFDFLEALVVIEIHKINDLIPDFTIIPAEASIVTKLLIGNEGKYVSPGKGGRVWIDDEEHVWNLSEIAGLHKYIIDVLGDDAYGLESNENS